MLTQRISEKPLGIPSEENIIIDVSEKLMRKATHEDKISKREETNESCFYCGYAHKKNQCWIK